MTGEPRPVDPADVVFCPIAYDGPIPVATTPLERADGYFGRFTGNGLPGIRFAS